MRISDVFIKEHVVNKLNQICILLKDKKKTKHRVNDAY